MVYKIILLLFFTFVIYVDAQQGNCNVEDPDWDRGEFWIEINDVETDYSKTIDTEHVTSVTLNHKYLEATFANNILTFTMKKEFEDFIKNEDKLQIPATNIIFNCETGGTPAIPKFVTLNVKETIPYAPQFAQKDYIFELSMPIAKNSIIEESAFIATDFNINEDLSFSFTGGDSECAQYFDFYTVKNNKVYTAKLKTIDHVNLDKSIDCNVRVTDKSGLTDDAKIAIKVDVENSKVPNPIFRDPIKIVDYVESLKTQLELVSSTYTPIPEIVSDSKFAQYFEANIVANNIIEIELKAKIPDDELENENYFVILVEVKYDKADNVGKTAVLVDLKKNTATTTTSTTTASTTTITSTTPCDCSSTTPDSGNESTTTISSSSVSDTTSDPGNTSTCPSPTTCPECPATSTSPGEGTNCPECPTTCPSCPETTLPGGSTACPECPETSTSPGEGTSCPECPTTCPSCPETTLPGGSTTCPETSTSPGKGTSCPECPTTCPETTLPGGSTTCPECPETSTSPGEGTSCPECPTTCPSCPETTLPGGSTTSPGEGTTCSECPTTCPSYPECPETTKPGESTTCPSNPECPSTSSDSSTSSLGSSTPSTSSPTTCPPLEPAPQVRFEKKSSLIHRDKGTTGLVETFKAVSDISEEITYKIKSVNPTGVKDLFEVTETGDVNILKELDEGTYDIRLTATGKQSKSQDEASLFIIIKYTVVTCPDNSIQVDRLTHITVKEGEEKKIVDANGNRFEFTTDNDDIHDWFKLENDNLEVLKIDREDPRIKTLLAPQIKVKIRALPKNTPPQIRYNSSFAQYAANADPEYSCLQIDNIDREPADTMLVLVSVEDENDNDPIFVEKSPLVIGYPEAKLIDLIAPPYLVKVTATDEDFGDYAKIKYTTNNKNFIADAENGIIFLANELSDNTEFEVIAEDNNGNNGNKAKLLVKVKLLKEEHISVITIENIAYSEIEDKVKEISSLTKQTVKYLSSTALPKVTEEEKKLLKLYAIEEKIPAVRIILYALDNKNDIISAKDFKEIADDTDLGIEIKVEEYIAAIPNENEEEDATGWIAAVSTLSVLLALVIIGGLLGYIFYLRPRMMESTSDGYKKHTYRDSLQSSSIETKMESANTLSDRRPTGFPMGFNPTDLDEEEDEENYEKITEEMEEKLSTKMEVQIEEDDDVFKESEISANTETGEQKTRRKSGVKFDTNVTEIEIEEF